jgi:hypothetical protein
MSGSGGDRDDYRTSTAIGSTGAPKGGGGGAGGSGGGGDDPCAIVQTAPINSPNPAAVAGLSVGDRLDVALTGTAPRHILRVQTLAGVTVGSLTHRGHLALINCIVAGNAYQAEVIQMTGGAVVVRIERV